MAPRAGRTRRRWSRTSRWSPWMTVPPVSRSRSAGSTVRRCRRCSGSKACAGTAATRRCSTSGPTIRARWSPPSRWSRARRPGSERPRNSTPATTRRTRSSPAWGSARPVVPGPLGDYPAWQSVPFGRTCRAFERQGHLGHRGARELALGCRRASDGADPHRRRLPDAGRHLSQRPGCARGPQRQAAVRPHRVGGPRGDGAVRPRPGVRRRRARRLLDGRADDHGLPAAFGSG